MTKETVERLYKHYCKLAEEGGKTGNAVRNDLIKADAVRHKEDVEKKHPWVMGKEDKNVLDKVEENKKAKK